MSIELEVDALMLEVSGPVVPFTRAEGLEALKVCRRKLYSAAGDDRIRNLFLVDEVVEGCLLLANFLLESSTRPAKWGVYRIKYIRKEGSLSDEIVDMRPVSIGAVICKLVERLIKPRLEQIVGPSINCRQAAFQRNRSTL